MKKFIAMLTLLIFLATTSASAIVDIPDNYWANIEINDMVDNNIIPLDYNGYFNPNDSVYRTDFTGWLLKVLQQGAPNIVEERPFLDVDPNTRGYFDILKSKEVGLVYGYPDGNFRPIKNLSRAETQSIMSHITRELFDDLSPLEPFVDKDQIPFWDLNQYAKTIYMGLYVNHPELERLEPNRDLTRAEAAVLLYRLKMALNLVKDEYRSEEVDETPAEQIIGNEQLIYDKCGLMQNDVTITNQRKILLPGNIFPIIFNQEFASKSAAAGDPVSFILDYDLMTTQGTLMLPQGTQVIGEVQTVTDPKWFNKNARVFVEIKEIRTPDGKVIPTKAVVYNKTEGDLVEGGGKTLAKVGGYALLGAAVGGGAVGVPVGASNDNWGTSLGIAIPVGAAVGVVGGLVTPGLNYKAHPGEKIYIEIREETSIWN